MIAIRGAESEIVARLIPLLPPGEDVVRVLRGQEMPIEAERYFYCQGLLRGKPMAEQTEDEIAEGMAVNATQVIHSCDFVLSVNDNARICVMGSESGYSGSYDETYAAAKQKLHQYVETKQLLSPRQQLVCVAPSIIGNCGMTVRREDKDNLERRKEQHPKQQFLDAMEVARLVRFLLYEDRGYISGAVIRMHGGAPAWR